MKERTKESKNIRKSDIFRIEIISILKNIVFVGQGVFAKNKRI